MGNTLRIATIGTSAITKSFLDAVAHDGRVDYVGAYSRSLERARAFGEPLGATMFFDDLAAMAASDVIDAVYVASPNGLHASQALAMIAGGKHVLCEKALASNVREGRAVFEAADRAGVVVMEAVRHLHAPSFAAIRDALPSLGALRTATLRYAKVSSRHAALKEGRLPGVFDPRLSEGALMDIGVYCVEAMVGLLGEPDRILAAGSVEDVSSMVGKGEHSSWIDVSGEVLCGYGDAVVNLSYGKDWDNHLSSQIAGDAATLIVPSVTEQCDLTLITPKASGEAYGTGEGEEHTIVVERVERQMSLELADFAGAVLGDGGSAAKVSWARDVTLGSLRVMDEIRRQLGVRFPADER